MGRLHRVFHHPRGWPVSREFAPPHAEGALPLCR